MKKMFKIDGNFWVGNYSFAYWFNQVFRPSRQALFPHLVSVSGFEALMKEYKSLTGKAYTNLHEFVGHFLIIYNETGGKMRPLTEQGSQAYLFEPGSNKASYNTLPGNVPCGTELANRGLRLGSKLEWNSTAYPKTSASSEEKAQADQWCDFSRFLGRGLNQLTGRANYKHYVSPIVGDVTKMSKEELDRAFEKPSVYTHVFYSFIRGSARGRSAIAELEKGNFAPYINLVSGNSSYHQGIFLRRTDSLLSELRRKNISRSEFLLKNKKTIARTAIITGTAVLGWWAYKQIVRKKSKQRP